MLLTKRFGALIAAAIAPTVLLSAAAGPAAAASAVRISGVQYDSPGSDTGSNYSLNGEWVKITNYASIRRTLTSWTLRDTSSHVYRFGTFTLGAGKSVRIHTGTAPTPPRTGTRAAVRTCGTTPVTRRSCGTPPAAPSPPGPGNHRPGRRERRPLNRP